MIEPIYSETPHIDEEFLAIALRYLDGLATPGEDAALADQLLADADRRAQFVMVCRHAGMLRETFATQRGEGRGARGEGNDERGTIREEPVGAAVELPYQLGVQHSPFIIQHFAPLSSLPFSIGSVLLSYSMATLILGVGLLIGSWWKISEPSSIAQQSASLPSPRSPLPSVVGKITGMVDCKCQEGSRFKVQGSGADNPTSYILHPKSLVALGDKYVLALGLMEITYDTGAKVILQGPVTYEVEANGGYLAVGKLTGKLDKKNDECRMMNDELRTQLSDIHPSSFILHPFVVRTPTATVTDLGTEFGVEVTSDQQSHLHVFQGKVALRANASAANSTALRPRDVEIVAGESARVGPQGAVIRDAGVQVQTAGGAGFVRSIPSRVITTMSLVDVVAGGNGFGTARHGGIDPATGKTSATQLDRYAYLLAGDGRYHRVDELPFIDGVFIPCGGRAAVQLDSAGHTFDGFPRTDNRSSGCVWGGGVIPPYSVNGENQGSLRAVLRGIDYSAPWHSVLGMHANKGITFDLEAIRRAHPEYKVLRFLATAGNPPQPELSPAPSKWCDVWVFVDGRPRFCRRRVTVQQELKIAVELDDQSRFLTLAATDGGDGFSWDCVIFGDPRLILLQTLAEEAAKSRPDEHSTRQGTTSVDETDKAGQTNAGNP